MAALIRERMSLFPILVCAILTCTSPPGRVYAGRLQIAGSGASSCSDSIRNCRRPIKFISKAGSCYTFACEYGASTQHNIHVSNPSDVRTLLQMARERRR